MESPKTLPNLKIIPRGVGRVRISTMDPTTMEGVSEAMGFWTSHIVGTRHFLVLGVDFFLFESLERWEMKPRENSS